jgi:hypothetical protein
MFWPLNPLSDPTPPGAGAAGSPFSDCRSPSYEPSYLATSPPICTAGPAMPGNCWTCGVGLKAPRAPSILGNQPGAHGLSRNLQGRFDTTLSVI